MIDYILIGLLSLATLCIVYPILHDCLFMLRRPILRMIRRVILCIILSVKTK